MVNVLFKRMSLAFADIYRSIMRLLEARCSDLFLKNPLGAVIAALFSSFSVVLPFLGTASTVS